MVRQVQPFQLLRPLLSEPDKNGDGKTGRDEDEGDDG